ncbi:TIGR03915 family putative DNA repair protein [Parabacteroides sp. Marseille-P3160]|uniref:TIGR03915 family putative DNA repair protein n=1 Tax=Parabacteroides sp. Marseille-P3160 TaxID=1917887 RepID=UPI0009BAC097|nr:TIGR03915 family putative DNA repair protein [Parabacteroides sp. Marseille-P3160]
MLVFFYDKTFQGLLTAVFEAYSRKEFPEKLVATGEIPPLFMSAHYTIVTEEMKCARVWTALEKKVSREGCNMLAYVWLSEQPEAPDLLFRYLCKLFANPDAPYQLNFGDPDVLEMQQLAQKVSHEELYLKQFVRFQKTSDGLFFAPVSPIYNALPLVIAHFKDRFADQKWVLYDAKRQYGYYYDLQTVEEITISDDEHLSDGKLDESQMAADEKLFQDLWKGYFQSITIKERLNPRLHRQHMPKRFWKYLTEKQE